MNQSEFTEITRNLFKARGKSRIHGAVLLEKLARDLSQSPKVTFAITWLVSKVISKPLYLIENQYQRTYSQANTNSAPSAKLGRTCDWRRQFCAIFRSLVRKTPLGFLANNNALKNKFKQIVRLLIFQLKIPTFSQGKQKEAERARAYFAGDTRSDHLALLRAFQVSC